MNQTKYKLSLLAATLLSVVALAVAPASASHGSDDGTSSVSGNTSSQTDDSPTSNNGRQVSLSGSGTETETETEVEHTASDNSGKLRSQAKNQLAQLRQNKQERSLAARQKVCENHQKTIDNKLSAFNQAADKHLTRLNDVFDKLKAYQSTNNLTVANYDTLVSDATAKQTAATTAVATLKSFGTTISCSTDDPAASLQTVKTAARETRQALQDYRKALKDLVVALHQAKGADSTDQSTGGDQ